MRKKLIYITLVLFSTFSSLAQIPGIQKINLSNTIPSELTDRILRSLDTLLSHINQNRIDSNEIDRSHGNLNVDILLSLADSTTVFPPELINLYSVQKNLYIITVLFRSRYAVRDILSLVASTTGVRVIFSIPLYYLTRNWKYLQVGTVCYHYPDQIHTERAALFDEVNRKMAVKLGLTPDSLHFYLCDNYQDIIQLFGYVYDSASAGKSNEGYGVIDHTIFSIRHHEDFSHDLFHYYAYKIRKKARNRLSEEGIAYSWGNAYYTDEAGEMVKQYQLVGQLKQYMQAHPDSLLSDLFKNNPPLFTSQAKVSSLLSSLLCDEVEKRKGMEGIRELINCGSSEDDYFRVIEKCTGINKNNFNEQEARLIANYHREQD